MALVRVRRAAQITLPREIRQAAHLEEGDYLEAQVTKAGILLRPVSVNSREPTPEQEAEILAVGAGWIITGDRDLLDLGQHRHIRIVTPRAFLEEIALA